MKSVKSGVKSLLESYVLGAKSSEIQCQQSRGGDCARHAAAMKMHDAGDDGQAQTCTAALSVGLGL